MTVHNPRLDALRQSSQPPTDATPEPEPLTSGKTRRILLGMLGIAASLAMAYFVGRAEGQARTETVKHQAAVQVRGREADVTKLEAALDKQRQRLSRLEARRQLHLSLIELEQHNFGTARSHLVASHAALGKSQPDDQSAEGMLLREMADLELPVATDIGPAKQRLLQFALRLDQLLEQKATLTAKSTPVEPDAEAEL